MHKRILSRLFKIAYATLALACTFSCESEANRQSKITLETELDKQKLAQEVERIGRQIHKENIERQSKEKFNNNADCQTICHGCIGCVNGTVISHQEYQTEVQNRRSLGFTGEQLQDEVWLDITSAIYMNNEYSNTGITVSDKEYQEMLFGDMVSPYMSRAFYSNGDNKRAWVHNFKNMLTTPQGKANFMNYKRVIIAKRKKEKFESLVQAGAYTSELEGKFDYIHRERTAKFKYVVKLFNSIPDSTIEVSQRDIYAFYASHKKEKKYKQTEGRDITIVKIPVGASEGDVNSMTAELEILAEDWKSAEDVIEFAKQNGSNNPIRKIRLAEVETDITESTFFDVNVGTVVGPYQKGEAIIIANVISRTMVPDTAAKVRHILLQAKDVKDESEMNALNSKGDSLVRLLKNGADFTELASKFSDDPGSKSNGGVYDFFPQGQMVKEFNDFSFNERIGTIGLIKTSYGIHVIEVLDRRKKVEEVEVAMIVRSLDASDKTKRDAYANANEYAIESTDKESLISSAKDAGHTSSDIKDIRRKATSLSGLSNATELVNWSYNAEVGDISQPILIDDNYIVAILTLSKEDGIPAFKDVEEKMIAGATKEAKGKYYASLMNGANLEEIAVAIKSTIKTANNVNLNELTVAWHYTEPKVAGLAFSIPVGEMSNPIIGNHGVWVIAPESITAPEEKTDYLTNQSSLIKTVSEKFSLSIMNSIHDGADIIDNRN